MMQSCASGGEAPGRRAHSSQRPVSHGFSGGSPPPRIVIGRPWRGAAKMVVLLSLCFRAVAHDAGRKTTPCGTSPVVTRRHRAMSSLRASATIIVLRVLLRPSAVRA